MKHVDAIIELRVPLKVSADASDEEKMAEAWEVYEELGFGASPFPWSVSVEDYDED